MKTILVPTDFSKNSLNAIDYAVALAKKENAKIILLNSYYFLPSSSDIPYPADIIQSLRTDSINKLNFLCEEISKRKKIKCKMVSKFDLTVPAIIETATEKKAGLIVMGTKGASGLKEVLMGSNTASVIEKAKCPVIAVPEGVSFKEIKKITYATDYHLGDIDALKKLVEIAKPFQAKITNLHASDEEFNDFSEETYLKTFKNKVRKKIKYGKMAYQLEFGKQLPTVLERHIKESSPNLIAMSTRHRNLFEKIFGSSVTKKMSYHTTIPLIAFHYKKERTQFI